MKIDSNSDTYSQSQEHRQKTAAPDIDKVSTEAGVKLENVRTSSVDAIKAAMPAKEYSDEELQEAIEKVNQYADMQKVSLRLQVEKELQQVIVTVVDQSTDEVIRQIPSEQAITMAKRLDEVMREFLDEQTGSAFSLFSDQV
ncbi:flagellar protein FlaG [Oceanospirillum maris]|uniref:flagellar protein FlaG n=1 Tax=Oceanospirillum maris TaxID=64977 RepID=UPI000425AA7D|nr:flagellar protein FlaG [Oceanospirillum maris]